MIVQGNSIIDQASASMLSIGSNGPVPMSLLGNNTVLTDDVLAEPVGAVFLKSCTPGLGAFDAPDLARNAAGLRDCHFL